ncbi:DUF3656 domain-containing U32 family peptidase [Desulfotruncus alcoholivorax]|uniref:DUF3656 domain-containing U32 family peptidase n=1 Tax=Desulfotruncus alcoholivorax TaxID=265477 RepID=UPI00041282F2|nr:DUF3656 domain-containing protein [Desulfotruncus alcoholivorax]
MSKPELLAPAGSREALVAAVQNGADAVYLGGRQFNARSGADNFNEQELVEAIQYAHARGVKIYVTVNILLADTELEEAVWFLHFIYNAGADAAIVQDLGLVKLAKQVIPELELHASTQMTAHNTPGVRFLKEAGLKRIVLARELSLAEVREIKEQTGVQLETFIHGALCVCYSGQCLMSSMIGGRSGNRGRCAQPCRLEYRLVDDHGRELVDAAKTGEYLLSPRDLNMSAHIPELIGAGIDSFKIEGRMRRPEYVATVVRVYRSLIDRALAGGKFYVDPAEAGELKQIFNRDFTTGYFFGVPGANMMSYKRPNNRGVKLGRISRYDREKKLAFIELDAPLTLGDGIEVWVTRGGRVGTEVTEMFLGNKKITSTGPGNTVAVRLDGRIYPGDRVFKNNDAQLMEKAVRTYSSSRENIRIPLDFQIKARLGEPVHIQARDPEGVAAEADTAGMAEEALKKQLTSDFLAGQLNRLGNTPFVLGRLECDIEPGVMVPVGDINDARRRVVESVLEKRMRLRCNRPVSRETMEQRLDQAFDGPVLNKKSGMPHLALAVNGLEGTRAAVQSGADLIYYGGDVYRRQGNNDLEQLRMAREYCREKNVGFYLATPRILHDHELEKYLTALDQAINLKPDGIVVSSYGLLHKLRDSYDTPLITDFYLNVFNSQSAKFLQDEGVFRVTLSPELTGQQIAGLISRVSVETEVVVQGALPLMVSRYCAIGSLLGGKGSGKNCSAPCRGTSFALRDRKGVVFPVETDANCLMHIYNSRELCLLDTLPYLVETGPAVLRVEARREDEQYIARTAGAYRRVLNSLRKKGDELPDLGGMVQELAARGPGYTRGHYYRGVID